MCPFSCMLWMMIVVLIDVKHLWSSIKNQGVLQGFSFMISSCFLHSRQQNYTLDCCWGLILVSNQVHFDKDIDGVFFSTVIFHFNGCQ